MTTSKLISLCAAALLAAGGLAGCFNPGLSSMENFRCSENNPACPPGYACAADPLANNETRCHKKCKDTVNNSDCEENYACNASGIGGDSGIGGEKVCMSHSPPDGGAPEGPLTPELGPPPFDGALPPRCDFHYEVGSAAPVPEGMFDVAASTDGVFVALVNETHDLELRRSTPGGMWQPPSTINSSVALVALAANQQGGLLHVAFVRAGDETRLYHCTLPLNGQGSCNDKLIYEDLLPGAAITGLDLDARDGLVAVALMATADAYPKGRVIFGTVQKQAAGPDYEIKKHCTHSPIAGVAHPRVAASSTISTGSVWQGTGGNQWKLVHFGGSGDVGNCPDISPLISAGMVAAPGAVAMDGDEVFFVGARNNISAPKFATWDANTTNVPSTTDVPLGAVVPSSTEIAWAGSPVVAALPDKPAARPLHPPQIYARQSSGGWQPLDVPLDPLGHTGTGVRGVAVRMDAELGPVPVVHVAYDGEVKDTGGAPVTAIFYLRCVVPPP